MQRDLIPFDLERASLGAKLITRDGIEVTEFMHFKTISAKEKFPCIAIIDGEQYTYSINGEYSYGMDHECDLFMKPIEKEYWFASGLIEGSDSAIYCTRLVESEEALRTLLISSALKPSTIQHHKITRIE